MSLSDIKGWVPLSECPEDIQAAIAVANNNNECIVKIKDGKIADIVNSPNAIKIVLSDKESNLSVGPTLSGPATMWIR